MVSSSTDNAIVYKAASSTDVVVGTVVLWAIMHSRSILVYHTAEVQTQIVASFPWAIINEQP